MAHTKSSKKRVRQNVKRRLQNRRRKEKVKDAVRAFEAAVSDAQPEKAAEQLTQAYKQIDKIAATGAIHKNTAARKKSRLAKRLSAMAR